MNAAEGSNLATCMIDSCLKRKMLKLVWTVRFPTRLARRNRSRFGPVS